MKCDKCGVTLAGFLIPVNELGSSYCPVCNQNLKQKKEKPMLSKETKINLFRLINSAIEDVRRFAILTDSIDSFPYPVEVLDELYKFKEKLMDKFIADDGVKGD